MNEPRKLLVVDDDVHIRRLLRLFLRNSGFEVHEAGTGEEAIKLAEKNDYDVILLDLILPYYGGFRLCQKFRRRPDGSRAHIVIMTGDDSVETRATATECGADDFLAKPFDAERVRELVTAVATR
ncbi:MAG TPA: response regulator [Thermoanaerobaculia bacterium]|nr:response regulator [Thermoanaerobaculia bacterium]